MKTFYLHNENCIHFVIRSWCVLWFEDQENTGIHFEISSWFKFVSFAFDLNAKCRKITEKNYLIKKASTHRIWNPARKAQELKLRGETSCFPLHKFLAQQKELVEPVNAGVPALGPRTGTGSRPVWTRAACRRWVRAVRESLCFTAKCGLLWGRRGLRLGARPPVGMAGPQTGRIPDPAASCTEGAAECS